MIKEYRKKDGSKAYMFVAYLGIDPITGKQKRTTRRGFSSKREAKIAEAKLQTEIEEKGFTSSENIKFIELYNLWLPNYKYDVKESSLKNVTRYCELHILPKIGNLHIKKITPIICQQLIIEWSKQFVTAKHPKCIVQMILDYGISIGLLQDNSMRKIKLPAKKDESKTKEVRYYSQEELQEFLKCVSETEPIHVLAYFRLLAFTGMRRGEVFALSWNDIDFKQKKINVSKSVSSTFDGKPIISSTKTKKSNRIISIDSTTLNILKSWKIQQAKELLAIGVNNNTKDQLVFSNRWNNIYFPTIASGWLTKIYEQHNIKRINIHGFRHTHCSLLFEMGMPLQVVQDRLGHSNIKTTMNIYTHVTEKTRDNVAESFEQYINY